jgi:hypothetical protein
VWSSLETKVVGLRSWLVAAVAAFLGWLLATLMLVVGLRPLGWVLLAAAAVTLAVAMLYARVRALRPSELAAFLFACMMLEWPILGFVTLLILSWARVAKWE